MSGDFIEPDDGSGCDFCCPLTVDTVPDLSLLDDLLLPNGAACDVAELLDQFELDKSCTIAADGLLYVVTLSGAGRWVRRCLPSLVWANRATWYINGTTGSDRADGSAPSPLKSNNELVRRIGRLLGAGVAAMDVWLSGAPVVLDWTGVFAARRPMLLSYHGSRTILYSGSVTARTLFVVPPVSPCVKGTLTDGAIPVSWTASGLVGKMLVGKTGTIAGRIGWIEEDLGAKTAAYNPPINPTTYAWGDVAVNDTFDIVDLLPCGRVIPPGGCSCYLFDLAVDGGGLWLGAVRTPEESNVVPYGCSFANGTVNAYGTSYLNPTGCKLASTSNADARFGAVLIFDGCALECRAHADPGSTLEFYEGCTTWGHPGMAYAGMGPLQLFAGGWWGVFNMPGGSVGYRLADEIGSSGTMFGAFWGLGNAGVYGLEVLSGNVLRVQQFTLLGYGPNTGADWYCAGATGLYAALPSAPANSVAGIVAAV